jgi:hypothetical protein
VFISPISLSPLSEKEEVTSVIMDTKTPETTPATETAAMNRIM